MGLSNLQYLMHQLGPATPEIVAIIQDHIDSWQVEFDEGVSLQLSWQEKPPRVVMSCSLGSPEDRVREQVYASLLNANLLLTGMADVKIALSHPDNDVMLIGEYELGTASLAALQDSLAEFLRLAGRFAMMVAGSEDASLQQKDRLPAEAHDRRA